MKRLNSIILIILLPFAITAQNFMTVGEVFDFEVNDEFHFKGIADGQPLNADRIKIIDKFYSLDSNTVYYVRYHNSYYTYVEYNELHYVFWTETDTVNYSNIDSVITSSPFWTSYDTSMNYYDTIIEPNEYYCDSLINGYEYSVNSFEPVYYSTEYGKGIGLVKEYYSDPVEYAMIYNVLFYYKKNDVECGIPDTTTLFVPENKLISDFDIFPIPARDILRIGNNKNTEIESISLSNINGQVIKQFDSGNTQLDISEISSGLYLLKISYKNGELTKKVIIE